MKEERELCSSSLTVEEAVKQLLPFKRKDGNWNPIDSNHQLNRWLANQVRLWRTAEGGDAAKRVWVSLQEIGFDFDYQGLDMPPAW